MNRDIDPNLPDPAPSADPFSPGALELPVAQPAPIDLIQARPIWWERIFKVLLFFISLYLFTLAISMMKQGARGIAPLLQDSFALGNPANSLGFGWFSAYLIMSGSPVAAAALTFFDAGVLDNLSTFAMITGSRLGASFIVLFIGYLYVLRGRDRATSLSMGLLALIVTATTYVPGFFLGAAILQSGTLEKVQLQSGALLNSLIDRSVEPLVLLAGSLLPHWGVFLFGLGVILFSFHLFDKSLPQMSIKQSQVGWMSRLVYRPIVMFGLGALVTMISMSVSLSLSILVPLSARGFIRRENVVPYIMGANITTFVDTLLAAVLLANPPAFSIVLVEMTSVAIVSLFILLTVYNLYRNVMLALVGRITASNRNLAWFMLIIFLVPLLLLLV